MGCEVRAHPHGQDRGGVEDQEDDGAEQHHEDVARRPADGLANARVDEEMISQHLYTAGLPDPDLLIRTSGEMRVSNFLLWQIAYAELYITETLWPDFGRTDLLKAILDFQKRDRRFGGLNPVNEPAGEPQLIEALGVSSR